MPFLILSQTVQWNYLILNKCKNENFCLMSPRGFSKVIARLALRLLKKFVTQFEPSIQQRNDKRHQVHCFLFSIQFWIVNKWSLNNLKKMLKFLLLLLAVSCTLNFASAGGPGECPQCIFRNVVRGIVDWAATDFSFLNPGPNG